MVTYKDEDGNQYVLQACDNTWYVNRGDGWVKYKGDPVKVGNEWVTITARERKDEQ